MGMTFEKKKAAVLQVLKDIQETYKEKKEEFIKEVTEKGVFWAADKFESVSKYEHKARVANAVESQVLEMNDEAKIKKYINTVALHNKAQALEMAELTMNSTSSMRNVTNLFKMAAYVEIAKELENILNFFLE